LSPQQRTVVSSIKAHVCALPSATAETPKRPGTTVGTGLSVVVPSPSWPEKLKPQQRTVVSLILTQVWLEFAAICVGLTASALASPTEASGDVVGGVALQPSTIIASTGKRI
jgi:hypothetical protein